MQVLLHDLDDWFNTDISQPCKTMLTSLGIQVAHAEVEPPNLLAAQTVPLVIHIPLTAHPSDEDPTDGAWCPHPMSWTSIEWVSTLKDLQPTLTRVSLSRRSVTIISNALWTLRDTIDEVRRANRKAQQT